ncbi:MAG: hypothetical protein JEZ08_22320 [Clostridiales bacterium]|nr:hypothetical protein [Clostridiales bacterium]
MMKKENQAMIEYTGESYTITIPSHRNKIMMVSLWCYLIVPIVFIVTNDLSIFDIDFIMASCIIGSFSFFDILLLGWLYHGREIIRCDRDKLTVEKKIWFVSIKNTYSYYDMFDVRVYKEQQKKFIVDRKRLLQFNIYYNFQLYNGIIRFEYNNKTIKIGMTIDEEEAKYLVSDIIKQQIHRYWDKREQMKISNAHDI